MHLVDVGGHAAAAGERAQGRRLQDREVAVAAAHAHHRASRSAGRRRRAPRCRRGTAHTSIGVEGVHEAAARRRSSRCTRASMASALSTPTTTRGRLAAREPLHLDLDASRRRRSRGRRRGRTGRGGCRRSGSPGAASSRQRARDVDEVLVRVPAAAHALDVELEHGRRAAGAGRRRSSAQDYKWRHRWDACGARWPWNSLAPCALLSPPPWPPRRPTPLPDALYTRGRLITPLARWLSIAFAFAALVAFWNSPQTQPAAGARRASAPTSSFNAGSASSGCSSAGAAGARSRSRTTWPTSLAVGVGAALSGGLREPHLAALLPARGRASRCAAACATRSRSARSTAAAW